MSYLDLGDLTSLSGIIARRNFGRRDKDDSGSDNDDWD